MASSSSSTLPVLASSSRSYQYDVFLSFRGEDVRTGFLSHFYQALVDRQIKTYKDDTTLRKGEFIASSLVKAIEVSRIAVVIFSKNYADSSWCLDELVHIMKCRDRGLMVVPVFYDVEPTDVRNQKRKFGEAFAKENAHNFTKCEVWRQALASVCKISGWELSKTCDGNEAQFIKKVIDETILEELFAPNSSIHKDIVGMGVRLKELESLLNIGSDDQVCMVGIWGLGGSGKTTLATSLYRKMAHLFQEHCLIGNVRERSSKDDGLVKLQNIILKAVCKKEKVEVQSVEEGQYMIKDMLGHRKVLVVLDDIDTINQLEALVGDHNWFGNGSRILITTRDKHLLEIAEVDHILPSMLLSYDESIMLFNRHAFKKNMIQDYETLVLSVVSYASGLPLALKVLGSFLYGKSKNEWISALKKLEDISDPNIMNILKISFDGLESYQKELFLDIACFWRHEKNQEALQIFEACGYYPDIGLKVLRQKSLLTIDYYGHFDMHDLIQEMGHYIVRGEHPNNPEKRTRVWEDEDIKKICLGDVTMENNKIEAISGDGLRYATKKTHGIDLSHICKFISNMKKLRWLRFVPHKHYFDEDSYDGSIFHSNELRYLHWKGYPGNSPFADTFKPMNLVVLRLDDSYQEQLWNGCKHLPHLKKLRLIKMWKLVTIPEVDGGVSLQKLMLDECPKLEEIHPSIVNCTGLEYIRISECPRFRTFSTFVHMKNLKRLKIENCNLGDREIPYDLGELFNLQELHLCFNKFSRLDFSLAQLVQLKLLNMSYCDDLVELPALPPGLAFLKADSCSSLTTVGDCYKRCEWLSQASFQDGHIIDGWRLLQSMLEGKAIENGSMLLSVKGLDIQKAFTPPVVKGSRYRLVLPENWCNNYSGFLICLVWEGLVHKKAFEVGISGNAAMDSGSNVVWEESDDDDEITMAGYVPFGSLRKTSWWDPTYNSLFFNIELAMYLGGIGVRLVDKKSRNDDVTETSTTNPTSRYTPRLRIKHDTPSALTISLHDSTYYRP